MLFAIKRCCYFIKMNGKFSSTLIIDIWPKAHFISFRVMWKAKYFEINF